MVLWSVIDKYELSDKPHLIYNLDEKGVNLNHSPPRVVAGCEVKAQAVTAGQSSTVSILGCGNAAGNALPPYFILLELQCKRNR